MVDIAHLFYAWDTRPYILFGFSSLFFHVVLVWWWKLGDIAWKVVDYIWLAFALVSVAAAIANVRIIEAASSLETARNESATLYTSFSTEIQSVANRCPDWRKRVPIGDDNYPGQNAYGAKCLEVLCNWLIGESERYPLVQPNNLDGLPAFPESTNPPNEEYKAPPCDDPPSDFDSLPNRRIVEFGLDYLDRLTSYTPVSGGDVEKKIEQLPSMAKHFNENQKVVKERQKELKHALLKDANIRYGAPIFLALALALRFTKVTGEIVLHRRKAKAAKNKCRIPDLGGK